MVEAALVLPLAFLVIFGIIEFGLLFRSELTASNTAREGTRVAATQARSANLGDEVTDAITGAFGSLRDVDLVAIYRPEPDDGLPVGVDDEGDIAGLCSVDCLLYEVLHTGDGFAFPDAPTQGSWDPASMDACPVISGTDTRDEVAVFVQARHDFVAPFVPAFLGGGDGRDVRARSITKFEPVTSSPCAPPVGP